MRWAHVLALGLTAGATVLGLSCWGEGEEYNEDWKRWCCDISVSLEGRAECWDGVFNYASCCHSSVAFSGFIDVAWFSARSVDNIAIFTIADIGFFEVVRAWLAHIDKLDIANFQASRNVSVVCMDDQLLEALASIGQPCFRFTSPFSSSSKLDEEDANIIKHYVSSVLNKAGLDVLYTDADALWLQEPFSHLRAAVQALAGPALVASRGSYPFDLGGRWGATLCTGVLFFHRRLPEAYWEAVEQHMGHKMNDQYTLNHLLAHRGLRWEPRLDYERSTELATARVEAINITVALLPHSTFPRICTDIDVHGVVMYHCLSEVGVASSKRLVVDHRHAQSLVQQESLPKHSQEHRHVQCTDGILHRDGEVCCLSRCGRCFGMDEDCPVGLDEALAAYSCCGKFIVPKCQTVDGPPPCVAKGALKVQDDASPVSQCYLPQPRLFNASHCHVFASLEACRAARRSRTWLASFPGSGNTWLRTLIQAATGILTGSVYNDELLRFAGLDGEGVTQPHRVLGVKTHDPINTAFFKSLEAPSAGSVLLMVRNPLRAALSYTSFLICGQEHTVEVREDLLQARFSDWLPGLLKAWGTHTQYFLHEFGGRSIVVRFEEFRQKPVDILLDRILPWMGIDATSPGMRDRLECSHGLHREGQLRARSAIARSHTYQVAITQEQRDLAWSLLGETLTRLGYRYKDL